MWLVSSLQVPIMFLNVFGGIIAGIWLLILGKWALVVAAILSSVVSSYIIGFAMLPGVILSIPASRLIEKGSTISGYFLFLCSNVYHYGIIWYWSLFVFGTCISHINFRTDNPIPFLLMAYSVATGPVGFLASKEQDSPATTVTTFCTMVGCAMFMLSLILGIDPAIGNLIFIGIMCIGIFVNLITAIQVTTAVKMEEQYFKDR